MKAALNFQTDDHSMHLNKAMFNDNGNCGFVLKSEILRYPNLEFNPNDESSMKNPIRLTVVVISAQKLPQNEDIVDDISDPYVIVAVYGVAKDCAEKKTKPVKDNGFNPRWENQKPFEFVIHCPEMAFVKFVIKDEDIGKDQTIGYYSIRVSNIREGKIIN